MLHLLGTGAALSDPYRTTTMLAFEGGSSVVVVDCGGDVVQRMLHAGIDLDKISSVMITHEHPDHVSGFPLLMEKLWLAGRRRCLPVCGISTAIRQAQRVFAAFDVSSWEGLPGIDWREVALSEGAFVFEDAEWRITAAPGRHGVPVIGLRVEDRATGQVVAYSCDTERCDAITRLAAGAAILVHEATGDFPGHSTASTAAAVAAEAGVGRLLLVHLPPESALGAREMDEARRIFVQTEKGDELGRYPLPETALLV